MAEAETQYRTCVINHKRTLKDGTVKVSIRTKKYPIKGYLGPDGVRRPKSEFTDEQKAEIKRKIGEGVTKKRIMVDYHITQMKLNNILNEA
jgi:hypothetical protein